ncbi:hypothetical protein SLA2020_361750 [Shorea laevis]
MNRGTGQHGSWLWEHGLVPYDSNINPALMPTPLQWQPNPFAIARNRQRRSTEEQGKSIVPRTKKWCLPRVPVFVVSWLLLVHMHCISVLE